MIILIDTVEMKPLTLHIRMCVLIMCLLCIVYVYTYTVYYICIYVGPLSPVNNITVREICDTTISGISWTASSSSDDPECGQISYEVTTSPSDPMIMTRRITSSLYNITGLTPSTSYLLTITGRVMTGGVVEDGSITINTPSRDEAVPSGE